MAPKSEFDVKKLMGSENYHFWRFSMENLLALKKLDKCISPKPNLPNVSQESSPEKLVEAKSILSLSVDDSLIVHIRNAKSALEIWAIFQHLYEDRGLLRKTGLLRALMSIRLEDSKSMKNYVEEIMNISNRLGSIGFEIGDEWVAAILLAGLTEDYHPFILSIEGSGIKITADMIKQKLLDTVINGNNSEGNVLFTNKSAKSKAKSSKYSNAKNDLICFACGKKNHKAIDCRNKRVEMAPRNQPANSSTNTSNQAAATARTVRTTTSTTSTIPSNQKAASAKTVRATAFSVKACDRKRKDDWYIDSGCGRNMTPYGDIVNNKEQSDIKGVATADDTNLKVNCMGKVNLNISDNKIEVNKCLHLPDLTVNLLSVSSIVKKGNTVIFDQSGCKIYNEDNMVVAECMETDGVVGCLLYLVQGTRPDIAFAVSDVSRFNSKHRSIHWKAVKRILRYLKGTIEFKLHYTKNGNENLVGYTDSDWASDVDKRRSRSGHFFKLSNGAISWYSKCQPTVALSSTEAEYMALASCVQESIWLKQFGSELDKNFNEPIQLLCDNQSAISLSNCDGYKQRTKHIDIRHHYLREKVEAGTVVIKYISTNEMAADNLTKAVTKEKQSFCSKEMGLWF